MRPIFECAQERRAERGEGAGWTHGRVKRWHIISFGQPWRRRGKQGVEGDRGRESVNRNKGMVDTER